MKSTQTYEHLMGKYILFNLNFDSIYCLLEMYHEKRDLPKIYKLNGLLKSENLGVSWKILDYVFDAAYRAEDVPVMCEALDNLLKLNLEPKIIFLKKLGENRDTPD